MVKKSRKYLVLFVVFLLCGCFLVFPRGFSSDGTIGNTAVGGSAGSAPQGYTVVCNVTLADDAKFTDLYAYITADLAVANVVFGVYSGDYGTLLWQSGNTVYTTTSAWIHVVLDLDLVAGSYALAMASNSSGDTLHFVYDAGSAGLEAWGSGTLPSSFVVGGQEARYDSIYVEYSLSSPPVSNFVFGTDYENVTTWETEHILYMGGGTEVGMDNYFYYTTTDASAWIEGFDFNRLPVGVDPHSGSRCVGIRVPVGVTGEHRIEFNLMNLNETVGNELFVSAWIYYPTDFELKVNDSWFSFGDAFMTSVVDTPYVAFLMERYRANGNYSYYMGYRNTTSDMNEEGKINPYYMPTGWHHLEYYVYRNSVEGSNGTVSYWLDSYLMFNVTGIQTMREGEHYDWFTTPLKIYYTPADNVSGPIYLWLDDLNVYSGMPADFTQEEGEYPFVTPTPEPTVTPSVSPSPSSTTVSYAVFDFNLLGLLFGFVMVAVCYESLLRFRMVGGCGVMITCLGVVV